MFFIKLRQASDLTVKWVAASQVELLKYVHTVFDKFKPTLLFGEKCHVVMLQLWRGGRRSSHQGGDVAAAPSWPRWPRHLSGLQAFDPGHGSAARGLCHHLTWRKGQAGPGPGSGAGVEWGGWQGWVPPWLSLLLTHHWPKITKGFTHFLWHKSQFTSTKLRISRWIFTLRSRHLRTHYCFCLPWILSLFIV